MSDLADARRAGSRAAALEEAGYAGGARDVLRITCLCIRDEFFVFCLPGRFTRCKSIPHIERRTASSRYNLS